jgi:Winged helix-turn-helix domain (DUF2582)
LRELAIERVALGSHIPSPYRTQKHGTSCCVPEIADRIHPKISRCLCSSESLPAVRYLCLFLYYEAMIQGVVMNDEIGNLAGLVWKTLNAEGDLPLTQLKNKVSGKAPVFDWAIGWLARENKIVITPEKRSYRITLRERAGAVGA